MSFSKQKNYHSKRSCHTLQINQFIAHDILIIFSITYISMQLCRKLCNNFEVKAVDIETFLFYLYFLLLKIIKEKSFQLINGNH